MIAGAQNIASRLDRSIADLRAYAAECPDPNQRRYALSSAALVTWERDQLAAQITLGDDEAIRWALRSVVTMNKGLIDIGSDWQDRRSDDWRILYDTIGEAHRIEMAARP